jgi:hypothetical protein
LAQVLWYCSVIVDFFVPDLITIDSCGHLVDVPCHVLTDKTLELNAFNLSMFCKGPCHALLPCNHWCKGTCSDCVHGCVHAPCKRPCERRLVCGHVCRASCGEVCPPCEEKCRCTCEHGSSCDVKCGQEHCGVSCSVSERVVEM